jgi:hypothetical protein
MNENINLNTSTHFHFMTFNASTTANQSSNWNPQMHDLIYNGTPSSTKSDIAPKIAFSKKTKKHQTPKRTARRTRTSKKSVGTNSPKIPWSLSLSALSVELLMYVAYRLNNNNDSDSVTN